MPAGQGKDAEQFAAAVEQGRSPRTCGDEELARDLEIVAMLRTRAREFDPSPAAKAQAKQKLMALLADTAAETRPVPGRLLAPPFPASDLGSPDQAVTELLTQVTATGSPPDGPQPVGTRSVEPQSAEPGSAEATRLDLDTDIDGGTDVESAPGSTEQSTAHGTPTRPTRSRRLAGGRHSMPSRPAGRAGDPRRVGASGRRFTLVGSAALVLALALAGAGILASREALPGDGLYAVKRVSESTGLALTFDEVSRAHRHLDLASHGATGPMLFDGTTRLHKGDQRIAHMGKVACFAEQNVVPETGCVLIPDDLPWPQAAFIGCCVTTGVGAAMLPPRCGPVSTVAVVRLWRRRLEHPPGGSAAWRQDDHRRGPGRRAAASPKASAPPTWSTPAVRTRSWPCRS